MKKNLALLSPFALLTTVTATAMVLVGTTAPASGLTNWATVSGYAPGTPANNNPATWESPGVTCTKTENPGGKTYELTYNYTQVIVKAGSAASNPGHVNTLFGVAPQPLAGQTVWADTNGNGSFDPQDKDISHIIFCGKTSPTSPTSTPTTPTSTPTTTTPTPPQKCYFHVKARKCQKKFRHGKTTKLVKKVRTNATIKKVSTECILNGERVKKRHCGLTKKKTATNAKVKAHPKCLAQGARIKVKITYKWDGHRKHWKCSWRVKDTRPCRVHGNG